MSRIEEIKNSNHNKIVCRPEGRELFGVEKVFDTIPGYQCANCECNVLLSEEKLEIKKDNDILICYDCFTLILMDAEYVKTQNFIDVNNQEDNTLGDIVKEVFGEEDE